jgi:arylsulfatase A-like enzyme
LLIARAPRSLILLPLAGLLACSASPAPPRHAVLVVIDTLRADAIAQAQTPNLDALVRRGVSVPRAWSSGTWTAPSLVSLFTGMHVRQHGWDYGFRGSPAKRGTHYPPMPDAPTLGEVLRSAGFETTGIFASRVLSWPLGFERGFGRWRKSVDPILPDLVAEAVAGWREGERHFLYLHLMGPHQPLRPSAAAARRWGLEELMRDHPMGLDLRWLRSLSGDDWAPGVDAYRRAYFAVLEDTDAILGRIVRALEPQRERTLLVVTADHGEMLGEQLVFGHRAWVFEPLTHIPLIAVGAGALPARLSLAAVPDLVTSALGVEHAWRVRVDAGGPLVSQRQGQLALSLDGRFKAIWKEGRELLAVYDLEAAPLEGQALEGREAEFEALRRAFELAVPAGSIAQEAIPADREMLEALEALGYLDDGRAGGASP